MSITAKELAKKLNLSEAAISMALNKKPGVSTKTRKMVLEAAEKYGYDFTRISGRPNRSGMVTFVIFKKHGAIVSDTPFFSEVTEGVQQKCSEYGFKLNIEHLYKEDYLGSQAEQIMDSDPAGIILLGTEMSREDFLPFSMLRIPVVLLDVYMRDVDVDCILINNSQGAYLATEHLITATKSQPGYLHSSYSISNFEERADGFYKAIRAHGMSPSKSIVHQLTPSIDGATADMQEILNSGEEIARAYFADNDLIAIGAMRALQQHGYRIPEDVAIVGFDNLPMCNYIDPPLTTINVPKKYMGEVAVARLLALIDARQFVPIKMEIHTNLVKRHSC